MKEEVDEHPFFSESSGSGSMSASMGDSWHLEPLAMNNSSYSSSLAQSKPQTFSNYQNGYSYLRLQSHLQQQQQHDQDEDQGRCYDHLAPRTEIKDEPQKVMHHFFDESPHNDSDDHNKDSSPTQLSISTPGGAHDFFLTRDDK